jgi:hypothetical protein
MVIDEASFWLYHDCSVAGERRETAVIRTVEAIVDEPGQPSLLEPGQLPAVRCALMTILEQAPVPGVAETALLSEA